MLVPGEPMQFSDWSSKQQHPMLQCIYVMYRLSRNTHKPQPTLKTCILYLKIFAEQSAKDFKNATTTTKKD